MSKLCIKISVLFSTLILFLPFTLRSQAGFTVNPLLCTGHEVTLTATNGTFQPTSFNWSVFPVGVSFSSPNFSVTTIKFDSPGTYTILLMELNATDASFALNSVTVNPSPTLTVLSSTNVICSGYSTSIVAYGAQTYSWMPSGSLNSPTAAANWAFPSGSTVYTITGNNTNGCASSQTVGVEVYTFPQPLTVSGTFTAVCAPYESTLTAFGAQHYTWTTSTGSLLTGYTVALGACSYSVYSADNAKGFCADFYSSYIDVLPPMNLEITKDKHVTCRNPENPKYGMPVVLTATGASQYEWKPYTPGYMTYSLGSSTIVNPTVTTCYTLTGTAPACSATAVMCLSVVSTCVGGRELEEDKDVLIFSNPVENFIELQSTQPEPTIVEVFDMHGRLVKKVMLHFENKETIYIGDYCEGMYLIRVHKREDIQMFKIYKE